MRVQSLKIDGVTPEGEARQSVSEPPTSTARSSFAFGCDAGFNRRPPEQRLNMPAQPLITRRSEPEPETDGRWRFLIILGSAIALSVIATQAMLSTF
jgi:hypothetical protein